MRSLQWQKISPYFWGIALSMGAGGLSAFATRDSMGLYSQLERPPLSPPGWLFPVVWSILFLLMGIASTLIYRSDSPNRNRALALYAIQLIANIIWPVLFFNFQSYFLAFLWLCLLWVLILATLIAFVRINPTAGLLLLPYLLWVTFAGYLNFSIFLLN